MGSYLCAKLLCPGQWQGTATSWASRHGSHMWRWVLPLKLGRGRPWAVDHPPMSSEESMMTWAHLESHGKAMGNPWNNGNNGTNHHW